MTASRTRRSVVRVAGLLCAAAVAIAGAGAASNDGLGGPRPVLVLPFVERPPTLEDFLDMQAAPELDGQLVRAEGFIQQSPEDGRPASQPTHAYLGYDRTNLYVVFVAFDDEPEKIRAHVGRRENVFGDEIVEIQLDTFGDERRAFSFVANPYGVQWDAIFTEGRRDEFDSSWDTVWQSRGQITDRGYVVWMAIPFKSLRFPRVPEQAWGVVLVRDIPRNNESTFWPRVSNRIEGRLNQAATLRGLRDISPGRNVQLIPYATSRNFRVLDRDDGTFRRDSLDAAAGLDAKLVLRDSIAIDATINPDFSQVESDEPQVTVNQRFEVFFPEKRPFFLENADLFDNDINLVFTRRIADPRVGGRLTGTLGDYTLGAMLIDDEAPGKGLEPGDPRDGKRARFGVLRLLRELPRQSTIGLIYTEREFEGDVNRVANVDGRIKLNDHWDTRFQSVVSSTRRDGGPRVRGHASSLQFNRNGRKLNTHSHYRDTGPEFETDVGFVPRQDVRDLHQRVAYAFRPEGRRLVVVEPSLFLQRLEDHAGTRLEWRVNPEIEWELRGQTRFGLFANVGRERLRPGDVDGLMRALDFPIRRQGLFFNSRFINAVDLRTNVEVGRGVNFEPVAGAEPAPADVVSGRVELTLRPTARLRIDNTYLLTRLRDRDGGGRILVNEILRSRWSFQWNRKLSFRAIVQYDSTRPNASLTSLEPSKNLNGDLLVTYLVNPWTALYAGYNTNYANVLAVPGTTRLTRDADFNDARQVFVKFSYLIRP